MAPQRKYPSTRIHFTRAFIKKRMAAANEENVELREEAGNFKEGLEKLTTMMDTLLASQATQAQAVQAQAVQAQAAQELAAQALATQNQAALALAPQNQEALANQNQATQAQVTVLQATGTPSPYSVVASGGNTHAVLTGFSAGEASNGNNEGFRYPGPHGFSPPPQHYMPLGYPWGMPFVNNEGTRTGATEAQFSHGQRATPHFSTGHPTPHATVTYATPLVHAT